MILFDHFLSFRACCSLCFIIRRQRFAAKMRVLHAATWALLFLCSAVLLVLATGVFFFNAVPFHDPHEEDAAAAEWIYRQIFTGTGRLCRWNLCKYTAFDALALPALATAPRAYRVLPLGLLAVGILYANTWTEHWLVSAAIGQPIPPVIAATHVAIALAAVGAIALPTPKGSSTCSASRSVSRRGERACSVPAAVTVAAILGVVGWGLGLPVAVLLTGNVSLVVGGAVGEHDVAGSWIISELFLRNEGFLYQATILRQMAFMALSLPGLAKAPRRWRIGPLGILAAGIIYVNTCCEHQLVLEATGFPIPIKVIATHLLFAAVFVTIIALPETVGVEVTHGGAEQSLLAGKTESHEGKKEL
eukprot:INCI19647.1.p1 GENE.INCI19647.1~~INCI19647.1.p1  ORF type:complete len:361 (+),score=41.13 INCI19647.1:144-1226(+)